VPISETERNPPFLTNQDWHVSGSYALDKIAGIREREQADLDAVIERTEEEKREDPFAVKKYMQVEEGESTDDGPPVHEVEPVSRTPMPSSWQEFQFLQQSVAKYAHGSNELPVSAEDLKYAEDFGLKLDEIYPVFKNILTEGWEFLFDPEVEEAGLFVQRMRKWEQGIGGDKKAVIEWDLEGEQQPFVGENKHD